MAAEVYEYDIFLSYPRIDPIGPWVEQVFDYELRRWLRAEMGDRRVFRDTQDIVPGDVWPDRLATALHRSKVMIAIWCPPYFTSAWCRAELETMRAREKLLGLTGDATRLVIPVRFSDGDYFDEPARNRAWHDFYAYSDLSPSFNTDPDWRKMIKDIRAICNGLEQRLNAPPPWSNSWPTLRPPAMKAPKLAKPGFA